MAPFSRWRSRQPAEPSSTNNSGSSTALDEKSERPPYKWSLGILSDPYTDEVPGSVILLSKANKRNEPLGLRHVRARTSTSSLPTEFDRPRSVSAGSRQSSRARIPEKKKSKDGKFILEPQPEDSANDPLNWPTLRRDLALLSLGFYCMVGGGMTPILAAGFNNVADTYDVSVPQVALTTGLYMLGLGIGSVIASPTAILWGKRPVYLAAIIVFLLTSIWCAASPNYPSLVVARIVQGIAVAPVECLPSATVAEIFFLHERAYRLGIYTLLLLGGKNLIPLVSAVIIQSLGWRWVFWIVAIVIGFCFALIFFFVPETFWDRAPKPRERKSRSRRRSKSPATHPRFHMPSLSGRHKGTDTPKGTATPHGGTDTPQLVSSPAQLDRPQKIVRVGFVDGPDHGASDPVRPAASPAGLPSPKSTTSRHDYFKGVDDTSTAEQRKTSDDIDQAIAKLNSNVETNDTTVSLAEPSERSEMNRSEVDLEKQSGSASGITFPPPGSSHSRQPDQVSETFSFHYTDFYRSAPPKSYVQSLKPWNGRLVKDTWFKVALRPMILFAYPAVLWSSLVYALAVGWLIVLSESVAHIYQDRESYSFTSLQVGLVYISPFVGGVLGTAVAGKISDIVVRFMAKKNDGVYEPEFRLMMAIPIALSTTIGLMGFGWSAEEKNNWAVPTVFFGIISFGCSLASTTAVTFVVDSYRQYAGEALVTLNFSKNVFHGFIFSLFFPHWLESSGSKDTFLAIGGIQLACMLFSIPMYIYGKRARMWTVRKNLMEKF